MMDADEAYFKEHGEPLFVSLDSRSIRGMC